MRIAFFLPLFPPYRGGAATDGMILAPVLGDMVTLYVVTERAPGYPDIEALQSPGGAWYYVLRILPRYASTESQGIQKLARLIFNRLSVDLALIRMHLIYKIELAHIHGQYARFGQAYILAVLGWLMHVYMVLDIRDKSVMGRGLNLFGKVLVASASIAENVKARLLPEKLILTPIPHAMPDLLPAEGLPERFFLFVGTVRRLKGVDVLLEAYYRYKEEGGPVPLVLIGPVTDPSLAFAGDVVLLGPKSPGFVAAAMKQCTLLLLPSRSEGLPHVCLEAIDLQIPFVVGPGIPEMEKECPANVLESVTSDQLLRAMKEPGMVPRRYTYDLEPHAPAAIARLLKDIYGSALRR